MCLNETYSKAIIGNHPPDTFPIQNFLRQGLLPLPFNYALKYGIRTIYENQA
jgi:hypothetical protein